MLRERAVKTQAPLPRSAERRAAQERQGPRPVVDGKYLPEDGLHMNRENRKMRYEKGYYKNHPCTDSFTCRNCGRLVVSAGAGSDHRNHCPNCLASLHVDDEPGDRAADCGGLMEPVAVWVRKGGEWAVIHRCRRCGKLDSNRVAADDNPMMLMSIALRPLGRPPFPLERIEELTELMAGDGTMRKI